MLEKPKRPLPLHMMAALRKVLPRRAYDRYVGRHEHGSMRLWRGIVAGLPRAACVLDIGAYEGEYALATRDLRSDLRIHAFEPNPDQLPALRGACRDRQIHVEAAAVAEHAGEVSFSVNGAQSQIRTALPQEDGATVSVPAVALDAWSKSQDAAPALMKIDVEGGESAILRGGRLVLAASRPIILCEVLTDAAGRDVAAAVPDEYLFFEINEDRGTKQAERPTRKVWRYYNWLLVPSERKAEIDVW